ncbi:DUF58 domain-containing protein [Aquibacillus koreensis]|uniref:DUF58 domain-containing protein n=1 Tax=Aquibacillus koreensis TaxID=279446 RepID=A0A9X4AJV6_9BACI|nr:DUF58 domain-containing protein [Aquibacillus koreensis]MCT2534212.1 DUF58 domain-containing protein [Aquibacillus koreensis]MDC3420743.1 DUF58 domain-containing protein [Aquibacillus koreensis]
MDTLLSPILTKRLANFKITSKKQVRGGHKGERRSKRLGSSLEFSDFRLYHPGDDLRQIDWNTVARTGKYYIKQFMDEQELAITIHMDCTKSMGINEGKWLRAKQLAATFSFLSLANADRVEIVPLASPTRRLPSTKGKAMVNRALSFIEGIALATDDQTFGESLIQKSKQGRLGGCQIIISDFLEDPTDLFHAIKQMQAKHQQVLLVQVVLPEEQDPDYLGDLKLIDIESSGVREVSMSPRVVQNYKQLFEAHIQRLQSFCNPRGIDFIQSPTSVSLERMIFSTLMGKGWIGR